MLYRNFLGCRTVAEIMSTTQPQIDQNECPIEAVAARIGGLVVDAALFSNQLR
jgi:hypothetical protein